MMRTTILSPRRALLHAFLALCLLIASLAPAFADLARQFVRPGETALLTEGKEEIVLTGTASAAVRLLKDVGIDGKATYWAVSYTAPNPPMVTEEAVTFTKSGKPQSVIVEVAAVPLANDPSLVGRATRILFAMVVVAIILEQAFAVLFGWRVFLEFFDGRGVKTVIMFVCSYLVVDHFNQDYVASLFQLYMGTGDTTAPPSTQGTKALTALVLAGGSASVNALMGALNIRQNKAVEVAAKPPPTKAWISVRVKRKTAQEVVEIILRSKAAADQPGNRLMGVINPDHVLSRLAKYFWRDMQRLPRSGGYEVDPKNEYTIIVQGLTRAGDKVYCDAAGTPLVQQADGTFSPEPQSYVFSPGAIVDFEVVL